MTVGRRGSCIFETWGRLRSGAHDLRVSTTPMGQRTICPTCHLATCGLSASPCGFPQQPCLPRAPHRVCGRLLQQTRCERAAAGSAPAFVCGLTRPPHGTPHRNCRALHDIGANHLRLCGELLPTTRASAPPSRPLTRQRVASPSLPRSVAAASLTLAPRAWYASMRGSGEGGGGGGVRRGGEHGDTTAC